MLVGVVISYKRQYNEGVNARCKECGLAIASTGSRGPVKRYCSQRCQKRAYRRRKQEHQFPTVMTSARRWVRADGKRPITIHGKPASSTDPTTWSTLNEVKRSTAGDGYGFMLGEGIGCYDLDNALSAGQLKPWARAVLAGITEPVIYGERSVSGCGLHIYVEAVEVRGTRRSCGDGSVEKYSFGRFIRCGEPIGLQEVKNARSGT